MDDLSCYLGRLVCSLGSHSCEDTEALLSVGHIAFLGIDGRTRRGTAFSHQSPSGHSPLIAPVSLMAIS